MSHETHYQILGIRRRASIEVIEAAYQRLQRLNQGEYVPVLPGAVVDETSDQARWRRIQLAYDILSSPVHRPIYDDKLWREERFGPKPAKKAPSRKFLDPLGAWLSSQKRADGFLFFRVGWSADFGKTQAELEKNIPAEDRLYSPETGQWRIVDRYDDLLDELFDNFERADQPPPKDLPRPIYQRKGIIPTIRRTWEPWTGWPLVLIAGLVVSIGATLIFPANRQADPAAQATATAAVAVNAIRTFNDPVITPSRPSSLPPLAVVTATLAFSICQSAQRPRNRLPLPRLARQSAGVYSAWPHSGQRLAGTILWRTRGRRCGLDCGFCRHLYGSHRHATSFWRRGPSPRCSSHPHPGTSTPSLTFAVRYFLFSYQPG
jgi:curved DNA-binding protein CbpA